MGGQGRPKLGLAFGGGGIRGMAHIGLIEQLDKHGVRADFVSGTSIGSCIAALYACGYKGKFMADFMQNINLKLILPFSPSLGGLMNGKNYAEFVRLMTRGRHIEEMEIPLRIVATDLEGSKMEVFSDGPIWRAVHASSAVPGVFTPVAYRDKLYVDGCLVDNCPCQVLRELGADIVIAVDLDSLRTDEPTPVTHPNLLNVLQRSINVMGRKNNSVEQADLVLHPMDSYIYSMDLGKANYALEAGRTEAAARIEEILKLLADFPQS